MDILNQPCYRKEGNIFVLYSANITSAGNNAVEVGRFSTLEELQRKSNEQFGQDAKEVSS